MPIMNGLQATGAIREFEKDGTIMGHIPIIAITANARPEHVQRAYEAGIDDVLTKPFCIAELLETIRKNIKRLTHTRSTSERRVPP